MAAADSLMSEGDDVRLEAALVLRWPLDKEHEYWSCRPPGPSEVEREQGRDLHGVVLTVDVSKRNERFFVVKFIDHINYSLLIT